MTSDRIEGKKAKKGTKFTDFMVLLICIVIVVFNKIHVRIVNVNGIT